MIKSFKDGETEMSEVKIAPIHPGEILLEEFLQPMELSRNKLALAIGVPARRGASRLRRSHSTRN